MHDPKLLRRLSGKAIRTNPLRRRIDQVLLFYRLNLPSDAGLIQRKTDAKLRGARCRDGLRRTRGASFQLITTSIRRDGRSLRSHAHCTTLIDRISIDPLLNHYSLFQRQLLIRPHDNKLSAFQERGLHAEFETTQLRARLRVPNGDKIGKTGLSEVMIVKKIPEYTNDNLDVSANSSVIERMIIKHSRPSKRKVADLPPFSHFCLFTGPLYRQIS